MDPDWTSFYVEEKATDWDAYYEHLAELEDKKREDNIDE